MVDEFDLERSTLQKRILRSLCTLSTSDEERRATQLNCMAASVEELGLDRGVFRDLLDRFSAWYKKYAAPPQIVELQKDLDAEKKVEQAQLLQELNNTEPAYDSGYLNLIDRWRKLKATQLLDEAVITANHILTEDGQAILDARGNPVHLQGPESAIQYLQQKIVIAQEQIDPLAKHRSAREIIEKIQMDYHKKRQNNTPEVSIITNLRQIDDNTNGGKPGELWTLAGFVGHGKTTLAINWVYNAINDDVSTLFISLEMPEEQVMNIFLTIHNFYEAAKYNRKPLRYENFRDKSVTPGDDEDFYWDVQESFKELSEDNRLIIRKPNAPMTVADVRAIGEFENQIRPLDMIVIDYMSLLAPDLVYKPKNKYDIINTNFMLSKRMAMEFARGSGIFVLTPHQINRAGHRRAQDLGRAKPDDDTPKEDLEGVYELDALADANEAERSSDAVLTIYQSLRMRQLMRSRMCFLKNRDGDRPSHWDVESIGQYRYIGPINEEFEFQYQQSRIDC